MTLQECNIALGLYRGGVKCTEFEPGCISACKSFEACDDGPPPARVARPSSEVNGVVKNRFISFVPGNPGVGAMALRVTLTSLHHPNPPYNVPLVPPAGVFSGFEGQVRWVGPPAVYIESEAAPTPFIAARLECKPHYQDWTSVGSIPIDILHVYGAEIVPSSIYSVQAVDLSCLDNETACADVSCPLDVSTARWGDVVAPFNPPSMETQPDMIDISKLVDKFRSVVGAPIKAHALLAGQIVCLSQDVGFADIGACVSAFGGFGYGYPGPGTCPPAVTCGTCQTNSTCGAGNFCYFGQCVDACLRCAP